MDTRIQNMRDKIQNVDRETPIGNCPKSGNSLSPRNYWRGLAIMPIRLPILKLERRFAMPGRCPFSIVCARAKCGAYEIAKPY